MRRNLSTGLEDKSAFLPTSKYTAERNGEFSHNGYKYRGDYFFDSSYHYGGYENVPHGSGKYYDSMGRVVFDGFFVHGKKEGYGWERDDEGNIYEGYFSEDMRHGIGRLVTRDGHTYEGVFIKGKLDHQRVYHAFPNGDVFIGTTTFSCKEQSGTMYYADGGSFTGTFGGYSGGWQYRGVYKKGSKTYEGEWSDSFYASRVTLTEYGRKTEIVNKRIK